MSYCDYTYYSSICPNGVDIGTFNLYEYEAERRINRLTTTADGICKLKVAFPTNEDDVTAIKRCICTLVNLMNKVESGTNTSTEGRTVTSISAGGESISYANKQTYIDVAMSSIVEREHLYNETITDFLAGVSDKNGVLLLYLGEYPRI